MTVVENKQVVDNDDGDENDDDDVAVVMKDRDLMTTAGTPAGSNRAENAETPPMPLVKSTARISRSTAIMVD